MKIINDKDSSKKLIISVVLGVGVGFVSLFVLLSLCAFIMLKADIGDSAANILSTVALFASTVLCGLTSSKKLGSKLLVVAPFSGFVFYLLVAIIGIIITKESPGKTALLRLLLCVVFAGVGALLGTLKNNKSSVI